MSFRFIKNFRKSLKMKSIPDTFDPKISQVVATEFDRAFYLETYRDVAAAGIDPLKHFLSKGWQERRNPNANFDTRNYLSANGDVATAGINPFHHYLVSGRAEGRSPVRVEGRSPVRVEKPWLQILRDAQPFSARLATLSAERASIKTDAPEILFQALSAMHDRGKAAMAISLSHDDYTQVAGGIQNCVSDEQRSLNELGSRLISNN